MAEKEKKKGGAGLVSKKIIQGVSIGLIAGAVAILTGFFGFSKNLELMTLDLRYRLRPQIRTLPEVGFIDYDDGSLELFGEWPWPRMRQVALVRTLDFYNARMAGYDVFFLERENTIFHPGRLKESFPPGRAVAQPDNLLNAIDDSFQNYDVAFANAMKSANNIYIAYYASDPDERIASKGLPDILKETEQTRARFSASKKEAMKELEKTFLPVPKGVERFLYKTTDFDPPVPDLGGAAKGVGFAQPGIDEDSAKRNYMFFRYYDRQMLYSITLRMLSDILDFRLSDVEIHPGEYILLKNARDYRTGKRGDIRIPVDMHCQTLLNWSGTFRNTFFHVPFRLLSYYYAYNTAKDISRRSGTAGFERLRDRIYARIMEEGMTTREDAERISKEIAAARIISETLGRRPSAEPDAVYGQLKGKVDRNLFGQVFPVVYAAGQAEKALTADPSLTFEKWIEHRALEVSVGSGQSLAAPDESYLREIFRNIKFFAEKKRLKEVQPYFFPPAGKVLSNGKRTPFSPLDIENKIFMIGLTGTNTIDLQPTPFEENCPLVALHVNAINTILTKNFLHNPPSGYKYIAAIMMALIVGIIGTFFTVQISFPITVAATGAYLFATYRIWVSQGYWLDWVVPLAAVVFTYMTIVVMQFVKAFREKKKVRGIFSTMVSPAVLKVMEENPDKFSLTGERKPATMLFSMINGIGDITRTVAPDELTSLLSIYLTPNSEIIMDYDGYIDKYEGHVIMADFGVPLDDENNPWKCAFSTIEQRIDVEAFKHFVAAKYGLKIGVSMGFNYGYVSAGNMGSERKFQYTVMGDPVNVSARFMASNFIYNSVFSITGEDTAPMIRDYVHLRPLDRVLLKGKTKPTAIFNVTGWKADAYMKLRGDRPVPEFLGSLWTKCPPEKIFGYQRLWKRIHARTGHPMAADIGNFFERNLDVANVMLVNAWKKEVAEYALRVESLRADILSRLNVIVDFPETGGVRDFRGVLGEWMSVLRKALEVLGEHAERAKDDRTAEAFIDQSSHTARLLLNKIEMLLFRLEQEIPAGALDARIEASTQDVKDFVPSAHQAQVDGFENAIADSINKYRDAAAEFYKTIGGRKQEYHEMMSIAGSPTDGEIAADGLFEEGLGLYWRREWDAALDKFREAAKLTGDRNPVRSLIERIESYKTNPPGEKWQGEFVQTKK